MYNKAETEINLKKNWKYWKQRKNRNTPKRKKKKRLKFQKLCVTAVIVQIWRHITPVVEVFQWIFFVQYWNKLLSDEITWSFSVNGQRSWWQYQKLIMEKSLRTVSVAGIHTETKCNRLLYADVVSKIAHISEFSWNGEFISEFTESGMFLQCNNGIKNILEELIRTY